MLKAIEREGIVKEDTRKRVLTRGCLLRKGTGAGEGLVKETGGKGLSDFSGKEIESTETK